MSGELSVYEFEADFRAIWEDCKVEVRVQSVLYCPCSLENAAPKLHSIWNADRWELQPLHLAEEQ